MCGLSALHHSRKGRDMRVPSQHGWKLVVLTIGVAGCDPVATLSARRSFRPAPAPDCVQASLAQSPFVESTRLLTDERAGARTFNVVFRDTVDRGSRNHAATLDVERVQLSAAEGARADSAVVVSVNYSWMGKLSSVSDDERHQMAQRAARLLSAIHDACAPQSPEPAVCEQSQLGRRGAVSCGGAS